MSKAAGTSRRTPARGSGRFEEGAVKKMNFGIIGTGAIARIHADALKQLENTELIACHSTNEEKGRAFAEHFGIRRYQDLDDLLNDERIDIVTICTPSGAHLEPALAAAERGKHLIVEKPLEITEERCDRIIEGADRNGVVVATVFQNRYNPAARAVKRALAEERLGILSLAVARVLWFRDQDYYDTSRWKGTWQFDGGGALMNQGIHVVDLLQWFLGEVDEVKAFAGCRGHSGIEVEDSAAALLRFSSGALGVLSATTAGYPGSPKSIEITGSRRTVELEEDYITKWELLESGSEGREMAEEPGGPFSWDQKGKEGISGKKGGARDPMSIGSEAHVRQFAEICSAISEGRSPEVDGREGKKSVEIVRRIYRSAGLL
jgi:predicted dehydrogenase